MAMALVLARRGMGSVRPNPPVGAVVVQDGHVVGRGFHQEAGGPHAEIHAIAEAGKQARGATLFVTLEPCNHQARTGPCVPAIVDAGIARVHFAHPDPNPTSGHGGAALTEAGIEVIRGPGRREAAHLVAGFASLVERGRPRITVKVGISLDGRLAVAGGDSKWITSEEARAWVHRRRREADAILVGATTALKDDPALTTRSVRGRSPDRFVVDSGLRVPPSARVWKADGVRRVAVTTDQATAERRAALEAAGVEVWSLPQDLKVPSEQAACATGRVDLESLAARLGQEGYTNLFVEGGGVLVGALFNAQLVDLAWVAMSRRVLLGGGGPGWTEGLRVGTVPRAVKIARADVRSLGPDWLFTLVPEAAQWWDPEASHV